MKKASSPDSNDAIIAQGSFSYTSPEGQLITITYVADDVGGFQPQVCFACKRNDLISNVVFSEQRERKRENGNGMMCAIKIEIKSLFYRNKTKKHTTVVNN